jgi:hypothetical protein
VHPIDPGSFLWGSISKLLFWGTAQSFKKIGDWPIEVTPSEEKKKKSIPLFPHRPPTPSPIIGSTFLGLMINKLFLEVSILFFNYSFEILKFKDYYLWMSKF